jgi:magnesium transporter
MFMKHAVAPLLEGISNLGVTCLPAMYVPLSEYFRDVCDHLQRLTQTTEAIRDRVSAATAALDVFMFIMFIWLRNGKWL